MRIFQAVLLTFILQTAVAQADQVVINELMASNTMTVADQDGEFDDWIELYNTGSQEADLSGYHLSDNPNNRPKFTIPSGTTIPANGYLIFWADEDGMQSGLHMNFKLSAAGEEVILWSPDTLTAIDEVFFGQQTTDKGYARIPNGTGNFVIKNATFGYNNEQSSSILERPAVEALAICPNPAEDLVFIQNPTEELVQIYDLSGKLVLEKIISSNGCLPLFDIPKGMYLIKNGLKTSKLIIK